MMAGFAYVPLAVSVAAGAAITKLAARPVLVAGRVITVAGLLLLGRAPSGGSYTLDLLPAFAALGLGCGMTYGTLQIAEFVGISGEDAGVGAGFINTSQEAGGALGLAVVATIAYSGLAAKLAAAGGVVLTQGAQAWANQGVFLTAACVGVAALLLAAFVVPRGKGIQARPAPPASVPAVRGEPRDVAA